MNFDQRDFRDALGTFATGITVVTTQHGDQPIGVTINSFASVSLEPPLVLFSLKSDGDLIKAFMAEKHFTIGILAETQQEVSNLFAGSALDKFDKVKWEPGLNDCPILDGTLATLECERAETHDGGDHIIFIGRVTNLRVDENGAGPLLYYKGAYETL